MKARRNPITDAQRADVLELWACRLWTQRQIAERVGLHYVTVHRIIRDDYYARQQAVQQRIQECLDSESIDRL